MCEANQVGELLKFGFVGFQKEVESLLQFKARHSDPLRPPHYHQVLYSWHVTRGDYRSGQWSLSFLSHCAYASCGRDVSAGKATRGIAKEQGLFAV